MNEIPKESLLYIAKQLFIARFIRDLHDLTGQEWERIFAKAVGGEWVPSNVGLDDVQRSPTCWGAKTIKCAKQLTAKKVRLISGRNSPDYSFNESNVRLLDPQELGGKILRIYNARVAEVSSRFRDPRTVVLMKGEGLLTTSLFETELNLIEERAFGWSWNSRNNLQGFDGNGVHKFTWQPHGSQFTMIQQVPEKVFGIELRVPEGRIIDLDKLADDQGFDSSWVKLV